MVKSLQCALALGLMMALVTACETTPNAQESQAGMRDAASSTLNTMKANDPNLNDFLKNAYAYAIFPSVGKGGVIVGGAYGRGQVYEQGRLIGNAELSQASIGAQLGGQTFSELICFQNVESLRRFQGDQLAFAANASAVALKAGASASARYDNGVVVFTMPNGGLMFEASIGGQKFNYHAISGSNQMSTPSDRPVEDRNTDTLHNEPLPGDSPRAPSSPTPPSSPNPPAAPGSGM